MANAKPAVNGDALARARLALVIADELDRRSFPFAGVVRSLARDVLEHRCDVPEAACPSCGGPVEQPARGRRRLYCSPRCRWAAKRRRASERPRNGVLVA
jgi:endogenous inhibitor of DNA gyrase (YacG/DUF329 family)